MKNPVMIRATIGSIALVLMFSFVYAQSITTATIQWNPSQAVNAQTGDILDDAGSITTIGKEKVEWNNGDGSVRYSFSVKEVIGSWENINQAGEITYEIEGGEGNGTATFKRGPEDVRVRLLIAEEGEQKLFELTIITLQVK